ncbi:MAG: molecular chaperone HscC [Lachnospira sp.]|nr:molecular chaperone HscC [Lachnospira sp.]
MAVIGIDLGTTNSLVAYWDEEAKEARMIPNALGEHLTPSVVSVDTNGEVLVGRIAKEYQVVHPDRSASVFKRHIGTKKEYRLGERSFLPEELSAMIVRSLKKDAESFLSEEVTEAVISVPAYFSDAQRKATKRVGELAGIKVERIISEPTAAAVAYGIAQEDADTKFLVFDLGGGTFDISILELFDSIMEVRAVAGDNYLGGEDFTKVLSDIFLEKIGLKEEALTAGERSMLYKKAETAKVQGGHAYELELMIGEELKQATISEFEYEAKCKALLSRLREPVERALSDASVKVADIDAIILVGGGTKLPMIRSFVAKIFGKLPYININPDEVVALGAAVQSALKGKNAAIKEVILTDVCPYTLGTSTSVRRSGGHYEPGHFLPIIERNSIIPVSKVQTVYTIYEDQRVMEIDILQGESRMARDNVLLGVLNVPVHATPEKEDKAQIRYTYDVNGLLEVEVTVDSSGETKKMIIEKDPGAMSKEEIEARFKELEHLKVHPRDNAQNRLVLARGERLYEEHIGEVREIVTYWMNQFENALDRQNPKEIEKVRAEVIKAFDELES